MFVSIASLIVAVVDLCSVAFQKPPWVEM
jgi:hypothetical protein